jgi:PIN domain nuclease of toxin-antitoxin system
MKLLLDTHAVVWWLDEDSQLSTTSRIAIGSAANTCFVSSASAWELATKVRKGKWPQAEPLVRDYHAILERNGFSSLPVSDRHALFAGALVVSHPDPFDRMLAAQPKREGLVLVTIDRAFADFDIETLW